MREIRRFHTWSDPLALPAVARNVAQHVLVGPPRADQSLDAAIDQHLRRSRVTQKREWARRAAIGAGLEDSYQIPDLRVREPYVSGERIQRRAQGTDDIDGLDERAVEPIHQSDREVPLYHLPEVSRRRQVMVRAAVQDEESLASRHFDVGYPRDVASGLTDEIAAWFDDESR